MKQALPYISLEVLVDLSLLRREKVTFEMKIKFVSFLFLLSWHRLSKGCFLLLRSSLEFFIIHSGLSSRSHLFLHFRHLFFNNESSSLCLLDIPSSFLFLVALLVSVLFSLDGYLDLLLFWLIHWRVVGLHSLLG